MRFFAHAGFDADVHFVETLKERKDEICSLVSKIDNSTVAAFEIDHTESTSVVYLTVTIDVPDEETSGQVMDKIHIKTTSLHDEWRAKPK